MKIRKDVIKLTGPIVAEQAFIMIMGVINTIMAGRIGKEAISAIGMVDSINMIVITFFSSLAVGATVVVAHYAGRKNTRDANEAAKQALASGLALSLAVTVFTYIFRHAIVSLLYSSADASVLSNAYVYLKITLLTYPFIAATIIAFGVLRGAGDSKSPMKITIIMNILNIILSYVLIYGVNVGNSSFHIYIPRLEVKGAAIGIAVARIVGAILALYIILNGSRIIKVTQIKSFRFNFDIQKSIFAIGIPASIESLLFSIGKLITQTFVVGMGTVAIASNYIANSVFSLAIIPGGALCIAATSLVGQTMGRGNKEEARDILKYLLKLSSVALAGLCILTIPLAPLLASMYSSSQDIIVVNITWFNSLCVSALVA